MGVIAGQHTVHTSEQLGKLRELLKSNGVQAFVVPSEDQRMCYARWLRLLAHESRSDSSEYLAHCDQRRAFISGFNGSAGAMCDGLDGFSVDSISSLGCAVVTLDKAFLFTDGRYFLQAGKQLDELAHWVYNKAMVSDYGAGTGR